VAARRDRALVTLAGVLPDLDGLTLIGGVDAYGRWHHLLTHGLASAVLCAGVMAALGKEKLKVGLLSLLTFHLHLVCDLAGSGPAWPIFYWWPFNEAAFGWNGGWELASWQNSVFGLAVSLLALWCALPLGRTVFELVSVKGDATVVSTLRARFQKKSP
jgi:hypothetical protein